MALEVVSGANFGCVLQHFSGPTRLKGSRGQVRPEIGQKLKIKPFISAPLDHLKDPGVLLKDPGVL